jgi:hypothetical protein
MEGTFCSAYNVVSVQKMLRLLLSFIEFTFAFNTTSNLHPQLLHLFQLYSLPSYLESYNTDCKMLHKRMHK